jgi:phosphoglycerate-specific signal transduction histidine kinase
MEKEIENLEEKINNLSNNKNLKYLVENYNLINQDINTLENNLNILFNNLNNNSDDNSDHQEILNIEEILNNNDFNFLLIDESLPYTSKTPNKLGILSEKGKIEDIIENYKKNLILINKIEKYLENKKMEIINIE